MSAIPDSPLPLPPSPGDFDLSFMGLYRFGVSFINALVEAGKWLLFEPASDLWDYLYGLFEAWGVPDFIVDGIELFFSYFLGGIFAPAPVGVTILINFLTMIIVVKVVKFFISV